MKNPLKIRRSREERLAALIKLAKSGGATKPKPAPRPEV